MNRLLAILTCFSIITITTAQESDEANLPKTKEVGLIFKGLNLEDPGLTFRIGTKKSLWRVNTFFLTGSNITESSSLKENKRSSFGIGLNLGKEFRHYFTDDLALRYGGDLAYRFIKSRSAAEGKSSNQTENIYRESESVQHTPGIRAIIGLNYDINNKVVIGMEYLPGLSYIHRKETSVIAINDESEVDHLTTNGIRYGFSGVPLRFSVAVRF